MSFTAELSSGFFLTLTALQGLQLKRMAPYSTERIKVVPFWVLITGLEITKKVAKVQVCESLELLSCKTPFLLKGRE